MLDLKITLLYAGPLCNSFRFTGQNKLLNWPNVIQAQIKFNDVHVTVKEFKVL